RRGLRRGRGAAADGGRVHERLRRAGDAARRPQVEVRGREALARRAGTDAADPPPPRPVDPALWPERLRPRAVALPPGADAAAFLERARRARHGRVKTWLQRRLRRGMSDFDVNGLLGMYPTHLVTTGQWRRLLRDELPRSCLDVGAGAGDVTVTLA